MSVTTASTRASNTACIIASELAVKACTALSPECAVAITAADAISWCIAITCKPLKSVVSSVLVELMIQKWCTALPPGCASVTVADAISWRIAITCK